MNKPHETYFASSIGVAQATGGRGERRILKRDYDFSRGDRRFIGSYPDAFEFVMDRARATNTIQQLRLVEGPLLGQMMWLIQTAIDGGGHAEPEEASEESKAEVPFYEIEDYINNLFADTSLSVVGWRIQDSQFQVEYEFDLGDEALAPIAQRCADDFVAGRTIDLS